MRNICISLSTKAIGKGLIKETKSLKEGRLSKGVRLRQEEKPANAVLRRQKVFQEDVVIV